MREASEVEEHDPSVARPDSVKQLALLLLKWKEGRRLPDSTLNEITNDVILYIQGLAEQGPPGDVQERLLSLTEQGIEQLKTRLGRESYWKAFLPFVEPQEVQLGRNDRGKTDVFHYVPIRDVLKNVLQVPGTFETLQQPSIEEGRLSTVFHGTAFQEHSYFSGDTSKLCLQLYSDEFEVCDPLGSKRGIHKLVAVYFTLLNLPQQSRSSISNIHLVLLAKDKHVNTYGLDNILAPLLKDIAFLETEGIVVEGQTLKGTVLVVTGDNLSLHRLGGFKCSFTQGRICRFCLALRHEIGFKHQEQDFVLRTPTAHQHHLCMLRAGASTVPLYGVKEPCALTFSGFDPTCHLPPDVMHDVLEGIIPFVLKHVTASLISFQFFALDDLNKEIIHFPYAVNDRRNKPEQLSRDFIYKKGSIKGNASQIFCLFRHLGCYVGDRVPSDCPVWRLYTLLREVVDLIMARSIPVTHIPYLQRCITMFLVDFHDQFPSTAVPPKMHFLVHYPSYIQKYGPLRGLWAMRFEAKHQYFKDTARKTRNFKNITLSLTTRHQCLQMYMFSQSSSENKLTTAGSKPCLIEHLPDVLKLYLSHQMILCESSVVLKSVTINGTVCSSGCVFVAKVTDDDLPEFFQICDIYAVNRMILGVAQVLQTVEFDKHFHLYVINFTSEYRVVDNLQDIGYEPLFVQMRGNRHIINPRHALC
ncbi:uncharacterized protein LOC135395121 [Ornithodoros turicata]|uniref:uncharacterized protein LOC135395121 n=1 Tax=Ornithodoros turicata TaxID=34597 RepID=UPI00313A12FE